jgi:trk system potassium uptake protein TrkA
VKLIDHNQTRCEYLTAQLDNVLVLCGEAADKGLLVGENIHNVDVFCAVTNDDEANIMACMQAKRLGARRVVALVNRVAYLDLLADLYIDVVLNPQGVTVSGILTHLRTGDFTKACVVHRGAAEIVEVVIRGDEETSNLVGQQVDELDLPSGVKLVSMMRSEKILWPGDVATIKSEDRMLLFVTHKDQMHQLEKMFQVRPLYV